MDNLKQQVDDLFKAKADRRKVLARLPWPEKVRITVAMQKMAYPIVKGRSKRACIWKLPEFEARRS